ncbi:MAG TPA: SPOR domain-containing protein [Devosia sp.]|nr:SPOR domain-containing protein [Devosia sp.]
MKLIRRFAGVIMTTKLGQPEQSDVTFWGISAVVATGIAILSTTLSAFVPAGLFGGLHANRLEGGTLNQLRAQVEQLSASQRELLSATTQLRSQFTLAERNRNQFNQRVSALEVSIPMLLEVVPPGAEIDPLSITASINDSDTVTFETEGGTVILNQTPLFEGANSSDHDTTPPEPQAIPDMLETSQTADDSVQSGDTVEPAPPEESNQLVQGASELEVLSSASVSVGLSQTEYGIALGPPVLQSEADALWDDISSKVGTLLIGLKPAISDPLQNNNFRVVLGPITNYSEAEMLCRRISVVGIECLPIQYSDSQTSSM